LEIGTFVQKVTSNNPAREIFPLAYLQSLISVVISYFNISICWNEVFHFGIMDFICNKCTLSSYNSKWSMERNH